MTARMQVADALLRLLWTYRPITALVVVSVFLLVFTYARSPRRRLPPGPRGLPLLGNALDILKDPWLTFGGWMKTYGPIMHFIAAGSDVIVLNDLKTSFDILDRRAAVTADRPGNVIIDMMTGSCFVPFQSQNAMWLRMRKASHTALRSISFPDIRLVQQKEATLLAADMLKDPRDWLSHLHRAVSSANMNLVYGTPSLASASDLKLVWLEDFVARITKAALPGAHLSQVFPWLRHVPSRFAPWKRRVEDSFAADSAIFGSWFEEARLRGVNNGNCLVKNFVKDQSRCNLSDTEINWLAASVIAGAKSITGVLEWWMLAMVVYPEVQQLAQEELDRVVKESLRWRPVDPIGLPHQSSEDIWYEGYFIPKGSLLIPNVWAMNRDPQTYGPDAHHFNPARFLDPKTGQLKPLAAETKEQGHVTFGFGRRLCVGRQIANEDLFITIATVLWAMKIEPKVGYDGLSVPIDVDGCVDDGVVVRPVPFECTTQSRFPEAFKILQAAENYGSIHSIAMPEPWDDQIAHFQGIPWCAKVLSEPGIIARPLVSREFDPDNRIFEFWGSTLFSAATVPFFIGCFHMPSPPPGADGQPPDNRPLDELYMTKVRCFLTLGHGLSTLKKEWCHGGAVAAIFDECMGAIGFINKLLGFMPMLPQVTQNLNITYIQPVPTMSTVACTAVLKRMDGPRKFLVEAEITDEHGTVLAKAEAYFVGMEKRKKTQEKL
ncbi:cytochrome P450 [Colletotrichum scovillei]|nr:cytochrome P450 [Colletotrichum scovillei]